MASNQRTADFLIGQMAKAGSVSARKMFGEYTIYCDGKIVALISDDKLFVKQTKAGRAYIGNVDEQPPYPGAKLCFLIPGEKWDDADWLTRLIEVTTREVPMPAPKRPSKKT